MYCTVQYDSVYFYSKRKYTKLFDKEFSPRSSERKEPKKKSLLRDHYIGKVSNDPLKFTFNLHLSTTSATYHVGHTSNYEFTPMDLTSLLMQPCKSMLNKNNIFSQPLSSKPRFSNSHTPLHSKHQPHHA